MKHQSQLEEKYEWSRKGKTYKTKYFKALGELLGGMDADREKRTDGRPRTDQISHLDDKSRN